MEIITGTSGNDTLSGTSGNDTIQGLNGNDSLIGLNGNDLLQGGFGNDTLSGGAGNDFFALEYFDSSSFAQNIDIVTDFVAGQDKIDLSILGISDFATLQTLLDNDASGTAQITTRLGLSNGDYYYRLKINGVNADDLSSSNFNFSTATTSSLVEGTNSNDDLFGGLGNDTLQGYSGNDRLFGEQGNDLLQGGFGNDTLYGGAGNDLFALEYFVSSSFAQNTDIVTDFVAGQDKIDLSILGISDFATLQTLLDNDASGTAQITTRLGLSNGDYYYRLKINGVNADDLSSSNFNFSTATTSSLVEGTNSNDDLFGGLGNDTLQGYSGNDRLFGEQGNDLLQGGFGNDTLYGGAGNDLFALEYFNSSSFAQNTDIVTDFVPGQDKIDLSILGISDFTTLQTLLDNDGFGTAQITARFGLSNGDYYYRLKINGFSYGDLSSSNFNFSTATTSSLEEGTNSNDDLFGGLGNDTLQGYSGNDRLFGEQGNDLLQGGFGNDTLYGGAGNDLFALEYFVSSSFAQNTDIVTDFVAGQDKIDLSILGISDFTTLQTLLSNDGFGTAQITTRFSLSNGDYYYRLKINGFSANQLQSSNFNFSAATSSSLVEGTNSNDDLFGGLGNDTLQGYSGNDRLFGERGNDFLQGGVGNDTIYGGLGDDTAVYTGTRAQYSLTSNQGVFTITDSIGNRDGVDLLYGVQKLVFSDQILTIASVEANPTLSINNVSIVEGNSGTKILVFTVTRSGTPYSGITVNYATANGTAIAGSDYIPKTGTLTFGINETSKTISIVINGDTTFENNETFFVNLSGATNATISDSQGQGTIINDDSGLIMGDANNNNLVGGTGNDTLRGLGGNDTLIGGAGNDILDGGTGNDSMVGGAGNDLYGVTETTDKVVEAFNGGTDYVNSRITYTLTSNVENLTLTGTANINGTGNTLNNRMTGNSSNNRLDGGDGNDTLTGGAGNDTLSGGTGADSMVGGTGNDLYGVENLGDRIVELANQGIDTVNSAITYTLGANLENLTLTGTANINGIGNTLNNRMTGNSSNNRLDGGDGNDTLTGGAGNDTLSGGTGADSMVGGTGNDLYGVENLGDRIVELANQGIDTVNSAITYTLGTNLENLTLTGTANINGTGNTLNNVITGNSGNNILTGGVGNDTLTGGSGNDTLIGSTGNDFFRFNSKNEGIDRITDFSISQGDKIVVSASGFGGGLTANANLTSAQFLLGSSATSSAHRFIYNSSNGGLFFDVDGNGATAAVQIATLNTGLALTNSNIFVVS